MRKIAPYQIIRIIYLMRCIISNQGFAKCILKQLISKPTRKRNNNHIFCLFLDRYCARLCVLYSILFLKIHFCIPSYILYVIWPNASSPKKDFPINISAHKFNNDLSLCYRVSPPRDIQRTSQDLLHENKDSFSLLPN